MAQANNALIENKRNEVRDLIQSCSKQIASALPRHMTPERMVRMAFSACQRQPKLLECTKASLALAIINAAELGLEPNVLGHAYLVPYGNQCTLIPGYKGLIKLARNSGDLISLHADVVREGDFFEFEKGLDLKCKHVPTMDDVEGRKITHYYAVAHLKDGGRQFEVMTASQVAAIRKRSKAASSGPWVTDPEEMGKKTVIKRLLKLMPASSELERAVNLDEAADSGLPQFSDIVDIGDVEDVTGTPAPSAADKAKKRLGIIETTATPEEIPTRDSDKWGELYMSMEEPKQAKYDQAYDAALAEGISPEDAHETAYAIVVQ